MITLTTPPVSLMAGRTSVPEDKPDGHVKAEQLNKPDGHVTLGNWEIGNCAQERTGGPRHGK